MKAKTSSVSPSSDNTACIGGDAEAWQTYRLNEVVERQTGG